MADTIMTYGGLAGMRIGGGTRPVMRQFRCTSPAAGKDGCTHTEWSELDRPECPRHRTPMTPVNRPGK